MKYAIPILFAVFLGGCQSAGMPSAQTSTQTGAQRSAQSQQMVRTELVFGAGRTGGADVSDWAWQSFVDHEITPRFPDGLTILPANGQWREKSGVITHERSWMVIIVHPVSSEADRKIEELRETYKKNFQQEAVLRMDSQENVSF